MMHLVSYTILPKRDISPLLDELKRSAAWLHFLDDTWVIISGENASQLSARLRPFLLETDLVLIVEVVRESGLPTGRLSPEAWQWLNGWKAAPGGARSVFDPPL